jgi:uncharacterized protein YbjQ (UPF0145 family)
MGCAHYHIGYSMKDYMSNMTTSSYNSNNGLNNNLLNNNLNFYVTYNSQELKAYSETFRDTCRKALKRLQKEAALHQAHAVVGVKLVPKLPNQQSHQIEFEAIGIAVKLEEHEPPKKPMLCTTSMIEFAKLLQAGTMPVGVALGVGIYYAASSYQAQYQQGWLSKNSEIKEYSDALYQTRNIALRHLEQDIRRLGGESVLGYYTDFSVEEFEVENGQNDQRKDHILQFLCLGTVLAEADHVDIPKIKMILDLTA